MATPGQIMEVRELTNESTSATWTDEDISALVDSLGDVNLAAANIWRKKAAKYADQVDVSEAGASRKLSDLYGRATEQAEFLESGGDDVVDPMDNALHARVHIIKRVS